MKKIAYEVVKYSTISDGEDHQFMQIEPRSCEVDGKIAVFKRSEFHQPEAVLVGALAFTPEEAIELKKTQLALDVKTAQLRVYEAEAEVRRFEEMVKRYKANPDKLGDRERLERR